MYIKGVVYRSVCLNSSAWSLEHARGILENGVLIIV